MPWNLLVLPLPGGFFFCHFCHYFRYSVKRTDGYRLLFYSAAWGLALATAGRAIAFSLNTLGVDGSLIGRFWAEFAPFPYSGSAAAAFVLGILLPFPVNRFYPKDKAIARAMDSSADDLTVLLYRAAMNNVPVCLTLDNRKVYVGFVVNAPNLEQDKTSLALLPLRSGYRDRDSLVIRFELFYEALYLEQAAEPAKFCIVAPVARIASANYYDPTLYERHFQQGLTSIDGLDEEMRQEDDPGREVN